jgi:hypothetical protein
MEKQNNNNMNFKMTNMKILPLLFFIAVCTTALAQKQTFDIITYTPPKGWAKQPATDAIQLSKEDPSGTFCLITLYKSIPTEKDAKTNFDAAWVALVKDQLGVEGEAEMQPALTEDGWEVLSGHAQFEKDGVKGIALLVNSTGNEKMVNILIITNTDAYEKDMTAFLESIDLKKTAGGTKPNTVKPTVDKPSAPASSTPGVKSSFKFTTTNFDDGWTATEQEEWVEVTKGVTKFLIHYPRKGTIFPADPEPLTNAAWDILVAPRYSNAKNYKATYTTDYQRGYFASADVTDNKTGKQVFVAFFHKITNDWIEVITPDRQTFDAQFKIESAGIRWDTPSEKWEELNKLINYNKFAVAASDFTGTWTSSFTGMQDFYNVYTGASVGTHMNQSNEEFVFGAGNTYNWKLLVVAGMVGAAKFTEVKSTGKFSVPNNWQLYCSKIEGKPHTYHAYWTCIKGARLLHLLNADYPGSGIYTVYGKKK